MSNFLNTTTSTNNKTDEAATASTPPPKTFAFFDIETTGLPEYEYFKTKIIELSIVACTKEHIFQTPTDQLPRILQKLSICVNPSKLISCGSTEITKIDNFLVEHENTFNENVAILLTNFLKHLQQPVCLIAHNGFSFDFPILRKELLKFDLEKLNFPKTLTCVDSLPIFRKIDEFEINKPIVLKDENNDTDMARPLNELSPVDLLEMDKNNILFNPKNQQQEKIEKLTTEIDQQLNEDCLKNIQKINETTPSSSNRVNQQCFNNHFHRNRVNDQSINNTKETPKSENSVQQKIARKPIFSKRKLLDSFNATVTDNDKTIVVQPKLSVAKKKFTLIEIYKRLNMNQEPEISHYAEADTINLLKCVIKMRDDFFKFIDTDSILFSDVKKY